MKRSAWSVVLFGGLALFAPEALAGYSVLSVTRTWEVGSQSIGGLQQYSIMSLGAVSQAFEANPFNPTSMTTGTARAMQSSRIDPTLWTFGGSATATWNSATSQPPPTIGAATSMRVVFEVDSTTFVSAIGLGGGGVGLQNVGLSAVLTRQGGGTVLALDPFSTQIPPQPVFATLAAGTYEWNVMLSARTATGGAGFATLNADFSIPNPSGAAVLALAGAFCLIRRRARA